MKLCHYCKLNLVDDDEFGCDECDKASDRREAEEKALKKVKDPEQFMADVRSLLDKIDDPAVFATFELEKEAAALKKSGGFE